MSSAWRKKGPPVLHPPKPPQRHTFTSYPLPTNQPYKRELGNNRYKIRKRRKARAHHTQMHCTTVLEVSLVSWTRYPCAVAHLTHQLAVGRVPKSNTINRQQKAMGGGSKTELRKSPRYKIRVVPWVPLKTRGIIGQAELNSFMNGRMRKFTWLLLDERDFLGIYEMNFQLASSIGNKLLLALELIVLPLWLPYCFRDLAGVLPYLALSWKVLIQHNSSCPSPPLLVWLQIEIEKLLGDLPL